MPDRKPVIAVLGGTGKEGSGLALRWARAGYRVVLGSRILDRAEEAAREMRDRLPTAEIIGLENCDAAREGEIVILCVPYRAQRDTLMQVSSQLSGKIMVDVTVPLVAPKVDRAQLPPGGSAVQAVQDMLGSTVRVVSAFQNISSHHLSSLDTDPDCDVLVCSDDPLAADRVVALAADIGLRGWNAGVLANSAAAEALTSVLIALNKRHKSQGSGIRITGIPGAAHTRSNADAEKAV